jgi:hypothetical protein
MEPVLGPRQFPPGTPSLDSFLGTHLPGIKCDTGAITEERVILGLSGYGDLFPDFGTLNKEKFSLLLPTYASISCL